MNIKNCISENRYLLIILFLFFSVRLIFSYFLGWHEIPYGSDAISYNGYALAILNQSDWLTNPSFLGDYRAPGYPLFLALMYSIFGAEKLLVVYFFQAIIGTLTVYYIFRLSSSLFGEQKSLLSLFWAGFYFFYLWYTGMILRETLVFFLMVFSFYHLWVFFQNGKLFHCLRNGNLWAFIISFTFLLHTDPRYLFYIPFFAILFVIYCNFWTGLKAYSWVLGMLILLLVPWTIRNYIAYDGFVLINTRTIDVRQKSISIRTKPLSLGMVTQTKNKDYPSEQERVLIKKGQNPNNRTPEEIAIIKKDVYPASTFIGRKLYRFKEMWVPIRTWSNYEPFPGTQFREPWSLRHNISSLIFYGTLIPFFFVGIFYLFKTRNKAIWFLLFPIAIQAFLHFLMWGKDRYRMPIDAFIIILGCYGMVAVYGLIRSRGGVTQQLTSYPDQMSQRHQLSRTLLSVLIIVPVGFYCKFYNGPAENWVNNSLGGVFYVIFWCLVLSLFLRKTEPWRIAVVVLMITCFLEFLQLWHHQFLEFIRSYFIGRTILGTSFTWCDFPYYFAGCGIGWLWMTCLKKLDKNKWDV